MMVSSTESSGGWAEQAALRARCAHPRGVEPVAVPAGPTIPVRFAAVVAHHSSRLAVVAPGVALSFAELNAAANRVAHALLDRSAGAAEPVALLFGMSPAFVIASLGALKAGAIQVTLERDFPRARLVSIFGHSRARLLLTDAAHLAVAREVAGSQGTVLDVGALGDQPWHDPAVPIAPDALTSINYTSGSTGLPKGIVHDHRAILCNVDRAIAAFGLGPWDRLGLVRPGMVPPLYGLLTGAAVCPIELDPTAMAGLADRLAEQQVTVYRSAVSGMRLLLDGLSANQQLPALRLVAAMGEPAYPADVERLRRHVAPGCLFAATLGTRETGDYAYFFADGSTALPPGAIPGGWLAADAEVLVLDEDGRPVADGEVGELTVRAGSVPLGYWQRPDLTEAALLPDPAGGGRVYRTGDLGRRRPDGCLLHAGRRDFQVKIRGHRVEVGDVEHALLAVPGVKQAMVAGRDDPAGGQRLVGYVGPGGGAAPSVAELRRHLAATLAPSMVPSVFVMLAELPRTATGKLDRRALPAPGRARPDLGAPPVAPRGPLEAMLAEVWADVLGLDEVGVHDAFLDLGGDSLRANQVAARVIARLPLPLSAAALFAAPTIAEMATVILAAGVGAGDGPAGGGLAGALDDVAALDAT